MLRKREGIAEACPCSGCAEAIGLPEEEEGAEDALAQRMAWYMHIVAHVVVAVAVAEAIDGVDGDGQGES